MPSSSHLANFAHTQLRFLTFRSAPIAAADRGAFLLMALVCTWIAGIGRYWDHTSAQWWQYAGLGSVAYVFVMAALLWLVGAPLKLRAWSYFDVLLFVALTSPLAWAYALPVDRWMSVEGATWINVSFLTFVATWRVALLLRQLHVVAGLRPWMALTVGATPLVGILLGLTLWRIEHSAFQLMADPNAPVIVRTSAERTLTDAVDLLSFGAVLVAPWLLVLYLVVVVSRRAPDSL